MNYISVKLKATSGRPDLAWCHSLLIHRLILLQSNFFLSSYTFLYFIWCSCHVHLWLFQFFIQNLPTLSHIYLLGSAITWGFTWGLCMSKLECFLTFSILLNSSLHSPSSPPHPAPPFPSPPLPFPSRTSITSVHHQDHPNYFFCPQLLWSHTITQTPTVRTLFLLFWDYFFQL